MHGIEVQLSVILILLSAAVLVAFIAERIRVPYTMALVVTGVIVSFLQGQFGIGENVRLEPEMILLIFLPGLVFEAGFHIDLQQLRSNLRVILLLAIPGVILSTIIIGYLLNLILNLSLIEALLFGVLISATDPIAVVSMFKELGVNHRLSVIIEGESLFNDGVAIVVFTVLASLMSGAGDLTLAGVVTQFAFSVAGGVTLGLVVGFLLAELMRRTTSSLVDIAITTIAAYGTFFLADVVLTEEIVGVHISVSPVIAVVVAGLILGNYGARGRYSATSTNMIVVFWEFIVFLIISAIFLLIGFEVNVGMIRANLLAVAITIGVVLLTRAIVVYVSYYLMNLRDREIPASWAHVMYWGGLRGAVSIALALSLPLATEHRSLLITMAFGYVIFSVIVQGLTIRPLLSYLGISRGGEKERAFERMLASMASVQAADDAVEKLYRQHILSRPIVNRVKTRLDEMIREYQDGITRIVNEEPSLAKVNMRLIEREVAETQKQSLLLLRKRGIISDDVFDLLIARIDEKLVVHNQDDWRYPTGIEDLLEDILPARNPEEIEQGQGDEE